ncbi:hypothetical protein LEP1GSC032_3837 [Leptospira interrogans str. 2002000631]|uniref:Uncharacterized protein n=1 Tax=Leptospira interrogans serovar Pyrogenes str. L0374 TaxID=1049928 RepID=M6K149_LEPIR|nr:hypothetical protein LEP1GSC027_1504 [Leptospira interrogans str. 2002000624]EKQ45816.1 hypothetical protein LEP1GSC026_1556 [Leptospira interrogans str. 2002000623]EMJ76622.1 hypothetical protein LEP1GSC032_3837 [Leptospira interrogans str. 2002000631]EMN27844.1 hypothetical protein LEP1GSC083_0117 [Leptospira interrogans serovar Pyrogenes str. L0374]
MRFNSQNISKEWKKKLPPFFCGEVFFVSAFRFFSVFLFVFSSFILFAFSFRFLLNLSS